MGCGRKLMTKFILNTLAVAFGTVLGYTFLIFLYMSYMQFFMGAVLKAIIQG